MRYVNGLFVALAILVAGCAAPPIAGNSNPSGEEARRQRLARAITEGTFHCVNDNHANPNGWPKCSEGVPVVVLDDGHGGCIAMMPFGNFDVHVTQLKKQTRIRWYLIAPQGYEFTSHLGAIGIRFEKTLATDPDWTSIYVDPAFEAGGRRFRLDVKENAPKVSYSSYPVVRGPNTPPLQLCRDADPIIVNQDN